MIVTLEGIDNLGKTTQSNLLIEKGYNVYKSPDYSTDLGQLIKKKLFNNDYDKDEMALLFLADLIKTNKKILNKPNDLHILDRSFISTLAYQEIDYNLPKALGLKFPTLVIYFEGLPLKKGEDYLEKKEIQNRVVKNYEKIIKYFDFINFVRLNINGKSKEKIHNEIINIIKKYIL